MASKQLGKLRQWGREVILTKEKTALTEEFKGLEHDVELRKEGVQRLYSVCTEYHNYLHKRKEYANVEPGVKMLPVDAIGAVMMSHGEEYGEDSAFGQCLLKFGRAHCKIATLQESYALALKDTYLTSLESALRELDDYAVQRKKLDSRRLTYEAAMTRVSKSKKDKEVKEAEEELTKAKLRYEETSTDVQARIHAIQAKEFEQLHDLTGFLATEINFVEQYLDVLRETQEDWVNESAIQQTHAPRLKATPHAFAFERPTPSISSVSTISTSTRPSSTRTGDTASSDQRGDDGNLESSSKRIPSPAGARRSSSRGSIASTGTAHTSRRRRDSVGTAVSDSGGSVTVGKRINVSGWASNAVSSLGRSKKEVKQQASFRRDKDAERAFASLKDNLNEGSSTLPRSHQPSNSVDSFLNSSSNSGSALYVHPKVMRALYDFTGAPDELSFQMGDDITLISEVKDGWSMGELSGRRGLFPTNYTEEIISQARPNLPSQTMTEIAKRAQDDTISEDGISIVSVEGQYFAVYDEPFGDHHLAKSPLLLDHEPDTVTEEDEMLSLFTHRASSLMDTSLTTSPEGLVIGNVAGDSVAARLPSPLPQRRQTERKPPPPPPARRSTIAASTAQVHTTMSGGPYVSAPSSTLDLATASFPPPPAAPRRSALRSRSSNSLSTSVPIISVSPFDN